MSPSRSDSRSAGRRPAQTSTRKLSLYRRSRSLLITLVVLLSAALFLPWIVGTLSTIFQLLQLANAFSLGPFTSLGQNVLFMLTILTYIIFRSTLYQFTDEPFGASANCPECDYALSGLQLNDPLQVAVRCPECDAYCQLLPSELLPRLVGDEQDLAEMRRAQERTQMLTSRFWKLLESALLVCGAISLIAMIIDIFLVFKFFSSSPLLPMLKQVEPLVKDVIRPATMFGIIALAIWYLPTIRRAQWQERQIFMRLIAENKLHPADATASAPGGS